MSLPLLLQEVPQEQVPFYITETLHDLDLDPTKPNPILQRLMKSKTYYRFLGYAVESFLSGITPDLSEADIETLANIAKGGCLALGYEALRPTG